MEAGMTSMSAPSLTAVLALPLLVLTGCPRDKEEPRTVGEAQQSLEQASDAGQAEGLTSASVDISTNFTIGKAVKDGAAERLGLKRGTLEYKMRKLNIGRTEFCR